MLFYLTFVMFSSYFSHCSRYLKGNHTYIYILNHNVHVFILNISNKHNDIISKFVSSGNNLTSLIENINLRKEIQSKDAIDKLENLRKCTDNVEKSSSVNRLLFSLPNDIHPVVKEYKSSKIIKVAGKKKEPNKLLHSYDVLREKDLLKTNNIKRYCGERSYYLIRSLAKLEWGLIEFSLKETLKRNFRLISVPDILSSEIICGCGMAVDGERNQIYKLKVSEYGLGWCLSGTAELGLAAYMMDKKIPVDELPVNLASVSRCYRAEISHLATEKGLYRVHQFNKVEMFSLCSPSESDETLESLRQFQEYLLNLLEFHYQVVDMGPRDLGRQAFRKYDIEVWMPGYEKYGEISSCSNCTDYQTRRLNIRSSDDTFLHSLNGTVCAVPRAIIAVTETHPADKQRVSVPPVLQSAVGVDVIGMKRGPKFHSVKFIPKQFEDSFIR